MSHHHFRMKNSFVENACCLFFRPLEHSISNDELYYSQPCWLFNKHFLFLQGGFSNGHFIYTSDTFDINKQGVLSLKKDTTLDRETKDSYILQVRGIALYNSVLLDMLWMTVSVVMGIR